MDIPALGVVIVVPEDPKSINVMPAPIKDGFDEIAANSLKLTANDLIKLKVIDKIIEEPLGGAHRNPSQAIGLVKENILSFLLELNKAESIDLLKLRRNKYLQFGSDLRI